MKKAIISVLICSLLAVFACACSVSCNRGEIDPYDNLNAMLKSDYSEVKLSVSLDFGEDYLVSLYTVVRDGEKTVLSYSIDKFATVGTEEVADAVIKDEGTAEIRDGKVYFDGEENGQVYGELINRGINFKASYFENAVMEKEYFKADVKNVSGFVGAAINATDVKVYATFGTRFYTVKINYKNSGGNAVEYLYEFKG